jgi:hypothetical protein
VEASTAAPRDSIFALTVLRPYRRGQRPEGPVEIAREAASVTVKAGGVEVALRKGGTPFATVRKGGREWRLGK